MRKIISLIAYNNKDFLTLTSIYIQHLLRLKSLKNNYQQYITILKAWLIQSATSRTWAFQAYPQHVFHGSFAL